MFLEVRAANKNVYIKISNKNVYIIYKCYLVYITCMLDILGIIMHNNLRNCQLTTRHELRALSTFIYKDLQINCIMHQRTVSWYQRLRLCTMPKILCIEEIFY